jgi:hypothetical protein
MNLHFKFYFNLNHLRGNACYLVINVVNVIIFKHTLYFIEKNSGKINFYEKLEILKKSLEIHANK